MSKVLVVEDEYKLAETIQSILQVGGHDTRLASDGGEAWQHLSSDIPDIIVSDINMPEVNGYELLQRIRNTKRTSTIPFIFLTALDEREQLRQGMVLGADDYVTKPFSAKDILESIQSTISKRKEIEDKHQTTLALLRNNISYTLPHELRTPLQSIMGFADLINMDYQTIKPDEIQMMSGKILKSSQRLQRLIENSLIYAQLDLVASDSQQKKALRSHIIDDPAIVIEALCQRVAVKWNRSHDLRMKLEDTALRISKDNLSRIIEELVDNAFKFSEMGSHVSIKATQTEKYYQILIHDLGRGMTAQQLEKIGPYIQFERVMYEQQGSGLGLHIAKRLVELHRGKLFIRSIPKEGTLITIKFAT